MVLSISITISWRYDQD